MSGFEFGRSEDHEITTTSERNMIAHSQGRIPVVSCRTFRKKGQKYLANTKTSSYMYICTCVFLRAHRHIYI